MYGEHAAFLCKVVEIIEAAADISKHCGNRGSCRPHIKDKDKERIQDNIDDGSDHAADHGFRRRALPADRVAEGIGKEDKWRSERDIEQIISGKLIRLFTAAQKLKQRVHKDENQDCREDAEEQRGPAAEGRRGFRLFFSVLSQQDGYERASSDAQHICDRHVHDKYRIRKGDGGNLIGVMSLSHKKGIRHIVNYENKG